jgi:hypothetical protein
MHRPSSSTYHGQHPQSRPALSEDDRDTTEVLSPLIELSSLLDQIDLASAAYPMTYNGAVHKRSKSKPDTVGSWGPQDTRASQSAKQVPKHLYRTSPQSTSGISGSVTVGGNTVDMERLRASLTWVDNTNEKSIHHVSKAGYILAQMLARPNQLSDEEVKTINCVIRSLGLAYDASRQVEGELSRMGHLVG